jgi:hypothetical protein
VIAVASSANRAKANLVMSSGVVAAMSIIQIFYSEGAFLFTSALRDSLAAAQQATTTTTKTKRAKHSGLKPGRISS